jgi:hypothetical protein
VLNKSVMAFVHSQGWQAPAGILKSVSGTGSRYGALAIRFSGPDEKDLQGEYFTAYTDFSSAGDAEPVVLIGHGNPIDPALTRFSELSLGPAAIKRKHDGIFASFELYEGDPVDAAIIELIHAGALRWSSGSRSDLAQRKSNGEITRWPIIEVSLTPTPAEPRLPKIHQL